MSQAVTSLEELDLDISLAWIALGVARTAFQRCPSGENGGRVGEAEVALDRLLDARFAAQQ